MSVLREGVEVVYDDVHDVLYASIGRPVPGYGDTDEEVSSLILRYDADDHVVGLTILSYSKQDKARLARRVPFPVDFQGIDKQIAAQRARRDRL